MFTLSGFVSLDIRYSGFLIPIFSARNSNLVFVQDLRSGFIIDKFMLFDPDNYHQISFLTPPIQRDIGDEGILAFGSAENVLFGQYEDLIDQLRSRDLSNIRDIFSLVDAYSFCQDRSNLVSSVKAAKAEFGNRAFAEFWGGLEIATDFGASFRRQQNAPGRKPRDDFASAIDRLIDDANSDEWYRTWRKLWAAHPGDKRLLDLAKWWSTVYLDKFGVSQVLMTILSERHITQGYGLNEFIEISERWLLTHVPENAAWSNLWLQTTKGNRTVSFGLIDSALTYLESIPDNIGEGKNWSRIWKKILYLTSDEKYLTVLADKAVEKLRDNREFIRSVMLNLIKLEFSMEWSLPIVIEWLRKYERADNSWAAAFLVVHSLENFPAWDLGSKWLKSQSNLRSWYKVWKVLYDRGDHEEEAVAIARNWLKRTDIAIGSWPQIMAEVLKSRFALDDDEELAKRWINHRMYLQIFTSKSDIIDALERGR